MKGLWVTNPACPVCGSAGEVSHASEKGSLFSRIRSSILLDARCPQCAINFTSFRLSPPLKKKVPTRTSAVHKVPEEIQSVPLARPLPRKLPQESAPSRFLIQFDNPTLGFHFKCEVTPHLPALKTGIEKIIRSAAGALQEGEKVLYELLVPPRRSEALKPTKTELPVSPENDNR